MSEATSSKQGGLRGRGGVCLERGGVCGRGEGRDGEGWGCRKGVVREEAGQMPVQSPPPPSSPHTSLSQSIVLPSPFSAHVHYLHGA